VGRPVECEETANADGERAKDRMAGFGPTLQPPVQGDFVEIEQDRQSGIGGASDDGRRPDIPRACRYSRSIVIQAATKIAVQSAPKSNFLARVRAADFVPRSG
jgi:hypothetical protein